MKKFAITTATVGALAATAVGLAEATAAAPTGRSNAADTVQSLREEGYNVMINGAIPGKLSECIVSGVHPTPAIPAPSRFTTVYVDVSCPP
jgi:hypothetical protein